MRWIAAIFLTLALGQTALGAGLETLRFRHDGMQREFLLYTPRSLGDFPGKRPLVLVLHGGGGTARQVMRNTSQRFNTLAEAYGFVVAYPNAVNRVWDLDEGPISQALDPRIDDLGYFRQVIAIVSQRLPVDAGRVFATGISRGGQASYALACKNPGLIRAIAPVAMPLPEYLTDDCRAGPALGLAVMNGTEDPLVPYGGGDIVIRGTPRDRVLSTAETLALFRTRNGCAGTPDEVRQIDDERDGTRVTRREWSRCAGAPVVTYQIRGGGHTWPSGGQYLPRALIGRTSREIDAAAEAWAFFRRFQ